MVPSARFLPANQQQETPAAPLNVDSQHFQRGPWVRIYIAKDTHFCDREVALKLEVKGMGKC